MRVYLTSRIAVLVEAAKYEITDGKVFFFDSVGNVAAWFFEAHVIGVVNG
jgi:hypothetical protein